MKKPGMEPRLFHLLGCLRLDLTFHHKVWRSEPRSLEKQVKIGPFEHQFCHMVEFRVLEQTHWSDGWKRILSGQWFLVVVKVNYVGFPEA